MDPSKELTPAQEREARRKLRRVIGDGTPEEQARRVFAKVFDQAGKGRRRAAVRTLVSGIGRMLLDAWQEERRKRGL